MKFLAFVFIFSSFPSSANDLSQDLKLNIHAKWSFSGSKVEFEGIKLGSIEGTEASHSFDKDKSEFCCDREYTHESAHDMSEQESQRIVQSFLGPKDSYQSITPSRPSSGQR